MRCAFGRLTAAMRLWAGAMLLLVAWAPSAAAMPSAQVPTAMALLEASAAALEGAQTMRFAIETSFVQPDAPMQGMGPTMTGSGAFQAPDRFQIAMQIGTTGQRMEGIMIGQSWGRLDAGPWRPGGPGPILAGGPVAPQVLAATLREFPRYLTGSTVRDIGDAYEITATLDLARLEEEPDATWRFAGTSFIGGPGSGFELVGSEVTVRIDKATSYLLGVDTAARLRYSPPTLPEGVTVPEDFPTSEGMVITRLTVSDVNDPTIRIEPPQ